MFGEIGPKLRSWTPSAKQSAGNLPFVVAPTTGPNGSVISALVAAGLISTSTPTIVAGTGLGTSPSLSIAGIDQAGYITFTVGTLPATSATIATITFGSTWTTIPKSVILGPGSTNLLSLDIASPPSGWSVNGFTLSVGLVALAAGTYIINYSCS